MNNKKKIYYWFVGYCLLFLVSCGTSETKKDDINGDKPYFGTIHISVDETFKPVIEEQIKVYESTFPEAKIVAHYKSEAACFRDLQSDSTRMVIVARKLNKEERKFFEEKLRFTPIQDAVAYDAVAMLINKNFNDSTFTIQQLQKILSGQTNITTVMDGNSLTSTVRYLQDTILKGQSLGKNVVAAKNSSDVVSIVSSRNDVIGFVGLSWVGDKYDKAQQNSLTNVKFAMLECPNCEKSTYAKPSQSTVTFGQYPLARPLYCIVKENFTGLGTGFYNFMSLERGQLIFRRAFLAPGKMAFMKRNTKL